MKWIARALIGALVGFFATWWGLNTDFSLSLAGFSFELHMGLLMVGGALILVSIVQYYQIKRSAHQQASGEEEDALDEWRYKKLGDMSISLNAAMILNFLFICTSILTDQPLWLIVTGGVFMIFIFGLSPRMQKVMRLTYPERPFPSANDKDYAKKLLDLSDDGERHVMLHGLYKSFYSTNALLMAGMLLLLFYSIAADSSQLFGITVIAAILLFTNIQYLRSVKGK